MTNNRQQLHINHSLLQRLTNHAKNAISRSASIAQDLRSAETEVPHLLYAIFLTKGSVGSNILADIGIHKEDFDKFFRETDPSKEADPTSIKSSGSDGKISEIFILAYKAAKKFNYSYVGTEHLVYAIVNQADRDIAKILSSAKISDISRSIKALFDPSHPSNIPKIFEIPEIMLGRNPKKKKSSTPFMDKFCINMNKEASERDEKIIGRDREIQRLIHVLGRKTKNNPVLIGEAGVGKTALVSGLASRINSGGVPPSLHRKRIMALDVSSLVAGTNFRGEFESRLKEIIKEISAQKNTILFIDELHIIIGAGNVAGGLDLANILKPALARGELQMIGATTFSEYKKHIEKDAALERRFQPIQIHEPSRDETVEILSGIRKSYENFHNVSISDEAIRSATDLSIRYIKNRFLPDKAIDVIDEAASYVRSRDKISADLNELSRLEEERSSIELRKEEAVEHEKYQEALSLRATEEKIRERIALLQKKIAGSGDYASRIPITPEDIVGTVSRISKIPSGKISQEKNLRLKNIKKNLSSKIIGQEEAVSKISEALMLSQSGIGNPDRPLGSFLFLGPTGVGKTYAAKILAQEFFGSSIRTDALIRIDMSELMERHSVSSLIGSPAGYIGYGEGGRLTEKVRRNPYSVILFDEIEKAHPDIFNILLQILEDGILTDAEGIQVDFKNTIIILTSNIGTDDFSNAARVGFNAGQKEDRFLEIKSRSLQELGRKMRPELLNRLDHIVVFKPLGEKEIASITRKELRELKDRIEKKGIAFRFDRSLAGLIAEKSLSPDQGARLVRKNIQEMLENPIAEMIIYDKVRNGRINASVREKEISIT